MFIKKPGSTRKSKPISEALIKAKANEIWRKRMAKSKEGNSEGDWLKAEASLKSWHLRLGFRLKLLFNGLCKALIHFLWWWLTLPWRFLRGFITRSLIGGGCLPIRIAAILP